MKISFQMTSWFLIFLALPILLGTGCLRPTGAPARPEPTDKMPSPIDMREKINFKTEDGVEIIGDYLGAEEGSQQVLLLHMMPATRVNWYPFMEKLRQAGFSSLAIDFRGHGESVKKFQISNFKFQNLSATSSRVSEASRGISRDKYQILDYKNFSDAEQQEKILDARAAVKWLEENKGATKDKLTVIGASIGANLALEYLAENPEVGKAALLSPGLDYRGVKTDALVKKINTGQKVLLLASSDDEYSFQTIRELNRLNSAQTELREFSGLGHGTTMFERKPELMDEVINWIRAN
jgi:alpha-beta hydrolase superfamily lysophospholipase